MKNIFTLLSATLFATAAFARDEGKITVTMAGQKEVQVYVDGRLYQENNNNTIVINDVRPGNHTIRVYRANRNRNGNVRRNGRLNEKDLLYSSTIYLRPSHHLDVMINRFGKALVDERSLSERNNDWDEEAWKEDEYDDYRQAMSGQEFSQLVQRLRNQWFGRMGSARDAVNKNYFSTYQMRELLQLFSSEQDKLELAKLSYKNIVDRQNFKQVFDLFSYQAQSDLERFVKESRQ